jgi:hypothetical protein
VTDGIKGAVLALVSTLLVGLLFAYVYRLPIPMGGYIGPYGVISTYGMPFVEVLISVLVAWVFYGVFGGFIIIPVCAATCEYIGRKYADSKYKNKMFFCRL